VRLGSIVEAGDDVAVVVILGEDIAVLRAHPSSAVTHR
jgi:hypothetical protein